MLLTVDDESTITPFKVPVAQPSIKMRPAPASIRVPLRACTPHELSTIDLPRMVMAPPPETSCVVVPVAPSLSMPRLTPPRVPLPESA